MYRIDAQRMSSHAFFCPAFFFLVLLAAVPTHVRAQSETDESELTSVTLARFELSNGSVVEFVGLPEVGEVAYMERGKAGESDPVFADVPELTLLQQYLVLAPASSPLPRMLVDVDGDEYEQRTPTAAEKGLLESPEMSLSLGELIARRGVAEEISGTQFVDVDSSDFGERLAEFSPGTRFHELEKGRSYHESHLWSCNNDHFDFFRAFCSGSGGSGTLDFCDMFKWDSLSRNSKSERKKRQYSFAITAACSDFVDVTHYWWNGSSWRTRYKAPSILPGHWMLTRYKGFGKYYRRVKHNTIYHRGYLRAYTAFYN